LLIEKRFTVNNVRTLYLNVIISKVYFYFLLSPFPFLTAFILLSFCLGFTLSNADAGSFQKVTFKTEDGAIIEGTLFEGKKSRAVVFAHGMVFNQESWYPLAERLQKEGIASLAIDFRGYGNSKPGTSSEIYPDILGAVNYLEKRGFEHIALIAGSMGGAAILHALRHTSDPRIDSGCPSRACGW
jgi:pimeloyl-ACP methyl ester carboxylesterase